LQGLIRGAAEFASSLPLFISTFPGLDDPLVDVLLFGCKAHKKAAPFPLQKALRYLETLLNMFLRKRYFKLLMVTTLFMDARGCSSSIQNPLLYFSWIFVASPSKHALNRSRAFDLPDT